MEDKATKNYIDNAVEQIKDSIDYHFNELVEKPSKKLTKLPENIFVYYFLPYFCGEKIIDKNSDIISKWIAIAGNPNKEVDIIDDEGNVVITIPALVDSSFIDFKNLNKGQPIKNIIANYELHKNQLPVVGENYLRNTMDSRIESLTRNSNIQIENELRWINIFTRYKKIGVNKEEVKNIDRLLDDEISYD